MSKLNTCRYNDADKLDSFDWAVHCLWPEYHHTPPWIEGDSFLVSPNDCTKCKCYEKGRKKNE